MKRVFVIIFAGVALLAFGCVDTRPFSVVVVPDTQFLSEKWPEVLDGSAKWIVENRKEHNIKYVLHVGDMVEHGGSEREWEDFERSMSILDSKVPYILAVGNHDYEKVDRPVDTSKFNKHFPYTRFSGGENFVESFPAGSNDNSCHEFEAAGAKWLIISLIYNPDDEALKWANGLAERYSGHNVIVLTHLYLWNCELDDVGKNVWEKFAKKHENISLIVCGHVRSCHRVNDGEKSNKVAEMLFDWQDLDVLDYNSYLSILKIYPYHGKVSVMTYSPHLDQYLFETEAKFEIKGLTFIVPKRHIACDCYYD